MAELCLSVWLFVDGTTCALNEARPIRAKTTVAPENEQWWGFRPSQTSPTSYTHAKLPIARQTARAISFNLMTKSRLTLCFMSIYGRDGRR